MIRCRHCGAPNEAAEGQGQRQCATCGRALTLPAAARPDRTVLDAPPDFADYLSRERAGDSDAAPAAAEPAPFRESRGLGSLPVGDESPDLSAILADVPPSAPPPASAPFVFGETNLLDSMEGAPALSELSRDAAPAPNVIGRIVPEKRSQRLPAPDPNDEATLIGDAGCLRDLLDQVRKVPSATGWRVKNERGVVYELINLDAVVAWLQGKLEIDSVQIAQGPDEFKAVRDYPALTMRLGLSAPSNERLELDMSRASERHGGDLGSARMSAVSPMAMPSGALDARRQTEAPYGMGLVLVAIAVAWLLAVGGTHLAIEGGYVTIPAGGPPTTVTAPEPPSPAVARAITAFEDKNYTTATNLLRRLSKTEDDPRVHRYLALALHATNRNAEAQSALTQYRRALRRADGDHAGQVRPVRD